MSDVLKVKCPICAKFVLRTDSGFPFCSDRCRTIDLGNWASEKYVISSSFDPLELRDQDATRRSSDQHDEE